MMRLGLFGLLCAVAACKSTVQDDGVGGNGGGSYDDATTGSNTSTCQAPGCSVSNADGVGPSSASSGGNVEEPPQGLFDCETITLSCPSVSFHIYPDPADGWECIARLALEGEPGIVRGAWVPGPYFSISETLVAYRGDGKAIVQGRSKSCGAPGDAMCPEEGALPWGEPGPVQLCDVVVPADVEMRCNEEGATCGVMPDGTIANCVAIPEPTCAEVAAFGSPAE